MTENLDKFDAALDVHNKLRLLAITDGLPVYEACAKELGIKVGTFKSRLHRARKRIKLNAEKEAMRNVG